MHESTRVHKLLLCQRICSCLIALLRRDFIHGVSRLDGGDVDDTGGRKQMRKHTHAGFIKFSEASQTNLSRIRHMLLFWRSEKTAGGRFRRRPRWLDGVATIRGEEVWGSSLWVRRVNEEERKRISAAFVLAAHHGAGELQTDWRNLYLPEETSRLLQVYTLWVLKQVEPPLNSQRHPSSTCETSQNTKSYGYDWRKEGHPSLTSTMFFRIIEIYYIYHNIFIHESTFKFKFPTRSDRLKVSSWIGI